MTISIPDLNEMMAQGVHFGHLAEYWHPKMKPYIYLKRENMHILNLEKTQAALEDILPKLTQATSIGQVILLVGSKKQIRALTREIGEETKMPYIDLRWLGGTLTNFPVMRQSIKRMNEIAELLQSEKADQMIKKERLNLSRQLVRMNEKFGGLTDLNKLPDALFVIDPNYEKGAVKEARELNLPIYALADTKSDPSLVNFLIPANDDAYKSVALIMNLVKQAILEGQKVKLANLKPTVEKEV